MAQQITALNYPGLNKLSSIPGTHGNVEGELSLQRFPLIFACAQSFSPPGYTRRHTQSHRHTQREEGDREEEGGFEAQTECLGSACISPGSDPHYHRNGTLGHTCNT